jgi:hypothetical protein
VAERIGGLVGRKWAAMRVPRPSASELLDVKDVMRPPLSVGDHVERLLGKQNGCRGTVVHILHENPQLVEVAWNDGDFGLTFTQEAAHRLIQVPRGLLASRVEESATPPEETDVVASDSAARCCYCKLPMVNDGPVCPQCAVIVPGVEDRVRGGALPVSPLAAPERPFEVESSRGLETVCDGCGWKIHAAETLFTCKVDRRLLTMHAVCIEIWLKSKRA